MQIQFEGQERQDYAADYTQQLYTFWKYIVDMIKEMNFRTTRVEMYTQI
jgi:hypothetical protein